MHFVTVTDGNHEKGVSWAAGIFGCQASIFMPAGTVESRRQAIEEAGSGTAVITDLNYDGTVAYAARMAEEKGWILIQDTAWEGYEKYPQGIAEGYLTMAQEIKEQAGVLKPTHVFLQAGVGSMAGAVLDGLSDIYSDHPPVFSIVEPRVAACIYASIQAGDGRPHSIICMLIRILHIETARENTAFLQNTKSLFVGGFLIRKSVKSVQRNHDIKSLIIKGQTSYITLLEAHILDAHFSCPFLRGLHHLFRIIQTGNIRVPQRFKYRHRKNSRSNRHLQKLPGEVTWYRFKCHCLILQRICFNHSQRENSLDSFMLGSANAHYYNACSEDFK